MRDPKRIDEMLSVSKSLWVRYPDLRLGQLLANLLKMGEDIYYVEDDVLLERMKKVLSSRFGDDWKTEGVISAGR